MRGLWGYNARKRAFYSITEKETTTRFSPPPASLCGLSAAYFSTIPSPAHISSSHALTPDEDFARCPQITSRSSCATESSQWNQIGIRHYSK